MGFERGGRGNYSHYVYKIGAVESARDASYFIAVITGEPACPPFLPAPRLDELTLGRPFEMRSKTRDERARGEEEEEAAGTHYTI